MYELMCEEQHYMLNERAGLEHQTWSNMVHHSFAAGPAAR